MLITFVRRHSLMSCEMCATVQLENKGEQNSDISHTSQDVEALKCYIERSTSCPCIMVEIHRLLELSYILVICEVIPIIPSRKAAN